MLGERLALELNRHTQYLFHKVVVMISSMKLLKFLEQNLVHSKCSKYSIHM